MTGLTASAAIERRRGSGARIDPPALFKVFRRLKPLLLMRRIIDMIHDAAVDCRSASGLGRGRDTVNTVPWPRVLSTSILPW